MIKSRAEALARHLDWDIADLRDYRYHYGRTSVPVWSVGDTYYCVTKDSQKPARHRDGIEWGWVDKTADITLKSLGFRVWESKSE